MNNQIQAGYFLLETLIALALLGLLLLGLDAMQLSSYKATVAAYRLSAARQQVAFLAEALSVLRDHDSAALVRGWNDRNQALLPYGHGTLSGRYPSYLITLSWGNNETSVCTHNQIDNNTGCLMLQMAVS